MAATYAHPRSDRTPIPARLAITGIDWEKIGEYFWGLLCLILFMILGPFSAPIVLGYILFGKIADDRAPEPSPWTQE